MTGVAAILGLAGNDKITGSSGAERIDGGAGKDTLSGGAGDDTLLGGSDKRLLTGGLGSDHFVFNTIPNTSSNTDRITDFSGSVIGGGFDKLVFDLAIFTALAAQADSLDGTLLASQFHLGLLAATADDYLIYDKSSGKLYYDADGIGGVAQTLVVTLTGNPTLTQDDILII